MNDETFMSGFFLVVLFFIFFVVFLRVRLFKMMIERGSCTLQGFLNSGFHFSVMSQKATLFSLCDSQISVSVFFFFFFHLVSKKRTSLICGD